MPGHLFHHSQAFGLHDAFQIMQRTVEPVVEDNIIILPYMADLVASRSQTLTDHFKGILSPVS
jgi:hypothetical protein